MSPFSNGWVIDPSLASAGKAYRSTTAVVSGRFSLEVVPNAGNTSPTRLQSFGAEQFFPADALRGKPVYFSGNLWATPGATAFLRVWTIGADVITLREVRQASGAAAPALLRDVMDVPNDSAIVAIGIECGVEGTTGSAYFDDVALTTVEPDYLFALSTFHGTAPLSASLQISTNQIVREIPRTLYGMNLEWGWDGQGVWNENAQTFTPGVVGLAQTMGVSEFRFPGGILSDLYHWKDGLGPVAQRPGPVLMPGGSTSTNAFGTDEAIAFADAVGANLMITVNVMSGTPEEAADWVRYVKESGHSYQNWEVGNELYLDFTQFNPPSENWTAQRYADTFLKFATAMRTADPTIRLGAGLEYSFSPTAFRVHPGWEETVLRAAAHQIDFVSVHNGFAPVLPIEDAGWDVRTVYAALFAAPLLVKRSLDDLSAMIVKTAGPDADRIKIAVTEWGPGFKIEPTSRWSDHLKTLGSAIYAADLLKVFAESPRVQSSDAFKLADGATQGWIGIRDSAYVAKPVAQALELYTKHFGTRLMGSSVSVPGYESRSMGLVDAVKNVPYLDVVCSLDEGGKNLYIIAINKHFDSAIDTAIDIAGFAVAGPATAWTLNGTALDANPGTQLPVYVGAPWAQQAGIVPGSRIDDGGPGEVGITSSEVFFSGSSFSYEFPAHSVTSLVIPVQPSSVPVRRPTYPRTGLLNRIR